MYLIAVESILETQAFSLMAGLALALMVIVTGGVIYLTAADWRDRRRRKQDREASQPQRAKMGKKNKQANPFRYPVGSRIKFLFKVKTRFYLTPRLSWYL
jgi:hypothetical protein